MSALSVVTFNLRCVWKGEPDGINSFIHRAGLIYEKVTKILPDVICFQEVTSASLPLLRRILSEYEFYGQFRGADYTGEGVYIAVKKDRFSVLEYNCIWLSDTPYLPASRFDGQSEYCRICEEIKLLDNQNKAVFRIFNTHLDFETGVQVKEIDCIFDMIDGLTESDPIPFLITGDFNAFPDSEAVAHVLKNEKYNLSDLTAEIPVTFHDWGKAEQKIDYIFATKEFAAHKTSTEIWDDCDFGIYMSDHYPINITFEFGGQQ